ncbi:MAG: hypothetical protein ABIS92_16215 [Polyangia bacterium]
MKTLTKLITGTLLVSSTVFAQPSAPAGTASGGGASAGGEVDISVGQKPTLTVDEMTSQARQYQQSMTQVLQRVQVLQETARKQKDIIKLNCVSDKLVQAKVNASIADQAMTALQENIAKADEGGRTHEFTRLTIINQKVLVLGAEAENCIGEDLTFVGATRIDVEVDPNIPNSDPTQPGIPVAAVERPPAASTYR